jgi:hypothetical protein
MDSTQYFRKFDAASIGIPVTQWAGEPVRSGAVTCLFRSEMTFKVGLTVDELIGIHQAARPIVANWSLAIANTDTDTQVVTRLPRVVNFNGFIPARGSGGVNLTIPIPTGAWFASFSSPPAATAQCTIYFNRGVPLEFHAFAPRSGGNLLHLRVRLRL